MTLTETEWINWQTKEPQIGTKEQWERVRSAYRSPADAQYRRAAAAARNARMCGTDPSWYGF